MLALSLTLGVSLWLSCDGKSDAPSRQKPPVRDPTQAVKTLDPATVGSIGGTVTFTGDPPANRELMIAEVACKKVHTGPVHADDVVVTDGRLANVFVHIREGLAGYTFTAAEGEVEINQVGCIYRPLVTGARVGQPVTFVNSDPVLHNIHTLPKENDGANFAMPGRGMRVAKTFDVPEVMIKTKCDVHPWMRAYVGIVDHPFFAVTGADGAFSFAGVPPGDYVVEAWHEVYGSQTHRVTLAAGSTETLQLSFAASR
jgi:plastocyanin